MPSTMLNWISPGLGDETQLVQEPKWFWKEKIGSIVDAWSVAEDFTHISDQAISRLNELTQNSAKHDGPRKVIEFNCGLVFAHKIQVGNRSFRINEKLVSIDYNRLLAARELKDEFARQVGLSRAATANKELAIAADVDLALPVYVQAREIHYFFHFMTETLPQFVTIHESGANGPITLCDLNDPPGYVMGFIRALFPDLADRVTISGRRHEVEHALIVADFEDLARTHGTIPAPRLPQKLSLRSQHPDGLIGISTMFSNSHSANLRRLAEIGREAVAEMDKRHLPKRFLISRSKAKQRKLIGEDDLLAQLRPYGFEAFIAEDHTPLEQIAAFSQAEFIVAPHGAGMTNIMFASESCHAIELTQRQYVGRARHFIRLADVARCSYEVVLCDEAGENYEMKANVGNDVAIGANAIAKITGHVAKILTEGFRPSWRLRTDNEVDRVNAARQVVGQEARRYRFFGMQRSGNHAIINWVVRNLGTESLFLNCCSARKSPYETFTQLELNGEVIPKPRQIAAGIDGLVAELEPPYSLLISYENHAPTDKNLDEISMPVYAGSDFDSNVLIYRSYLNWLASYIRLVRTRLQKKGRDSMVEEVAQVARAVSQYTEMLAPLLVENQSSSIIPVSYDKWCIDEHYRAQILEQLGLSAQDNNLGTIQGYGGGSSFNESGSAENDPERFARRHDLMQGDMIFDMFARLLDNDPVLVALHDKGVA
ncbi:glycosyltransferase family 61 protein [Paracoccus seriniphilus]|uniref:glycosyltransferase family 61 protein n=1 Tax=Paracoccus seriniphilus TaxID=184748 RepID=UPI0035677FF0